MSRASSIHPKFALQQFSVRKLPAYWHLDHIVKCRTERTFGVHSQLHFAARTRVRESGQQSESHRTFSLEWLSGNHSHLALKRKRHSVMRLSKKSTAATLRSVLIGRTADVAGVVAVSGPPSRATLFTQSAISRHKSNKGECRVITVRCLVCGRHFCRRPWTGDDISLPRKVVCCDHVKSDLEWLDTVEECGATYASCQLAT